MNISKMLIAVGFMLSPCLMFAQISETEPNDAMTDSGVITIIANGEFSGVRGGLDDTQDLWFIADGTGGFLQIDWEYDDEPFSYFMEVMEHATSDRSGFGVSAGSNYSTQTGTWSFDLNGSKFYTVEFSAITIDPSLYSFTVSGSAFDNTGPTNTAPTLVANTGISVTQGESVVIAQAYLGYTDSEQEASELIYSLAAPPTNGTLVFSPGVIAPYSLTTGDQFPQSAVNVGMISYEHGGEGTDDFVLSLSDGTETIENIVVDVYVTIPNYPPVFSSLSSAAFEENTTGTVLDVEAHDGDGEEADEGVFYSIVEQLDHELFAIEELTGILTFVLPPDFENPLDTDEDNVYEVTVAAYDGTHTTEQEIEITVTDVDEVPPSASIEGGAVGAALIPVTITWDEPVNGFDISDLILGNCDVQDFATNDNQVFTMNLVPLANGKVGVKVPASAVDDGRNNNEETQALFTTYQNEDEPLTLIAGSPIDYLTPSLMQGGGGLRNGEAIFARFLMADIAVADNGTIYVADGLNHRIRKIEPSGQVSTYAGGGESGVFEGDYLDGPRLFARFDNPRGVAVDADGNVYVADTNNQRIRMIRASDGEVITLAGNGNTGYANGAALSTTFANPVALDIDSQGRIFIADQENGVVRLLDNGQVTSLFDPIPYRVKDVHVENSGDVLYTASAGVVRWLAADRSFELVSGILNTTYYGAISDPDGQVFALIGDTSSGLAVIHVTGEETGEYAVDYTEFACYKTAGQSINLVDIAYANGQIIVLDACNTTIWSFESPTMETNNPPVFTSISSINFDENGVEPILDINANDGDGGSTDEGVTYVLVEQYDFALFGLNESSGTLNFLSVPDYETPLDTDQDNVYKVVVAASDGTHSPEQLITITINNLDEDAPTITSSITMSVPENTSGVIYTATADEQVTFTLGDSKDESLFTLTNDNEISFTAAPDYETPQDGDGDNVYLIDVIATDGSDNATTVEVAITVTGVDEETRQPQEIVFGAFDVVTYGADPIELSATGGDSGNPVTFISSDPTVAEVSSVNQLIIRGAGLVQIKANQAGNDAYFDADEVSQQIEVFKKELLAKAQDEEKVYGQLNPSFVIQYDGFVNGEDVAVLTEFATATTTATSESGVGNYPITVTGGKADNYILIGLSGELAITAAPLSIIADDKEITVGDDLPALTTTIQGWVNDDDEFSITMPSIITEATDSSEPGTYPITLTGGHADNYKLELVDGSLIINEVLGVDYANSLILYPNPVHAAIIVDAESYSKLVSLDIFNLQGMLVKKLEPRFGVHDVDALESGTYLLVIGANENVTVKKFKKR